MISRHGFDVSMAFIDGFRFAGFPFGTRRSVKHLHMIAHGSRNADGQLEYIGAVQDVTQRRLAEEALGKVRSELTHAARVTSLGELTASIAHEVNQPLPAVLNNANACLSFLPDSVPNLQEIRSALAEIIEDADRASAVVGRVRQLVRKEPFAKALLNLRDVAVASDAAPVRVKGWRAIHKKQIPAITMMEFQTGRPAAIGRAAHWSGCGIPAIEITCEAYGLRAWGIAEKTHVMLLPHGGVTPLRVS